MSSATIQPKQKYDVFISFRGKDTRRTFTSHLHAALIRRKVETFIDYRLERGDEVGPALLKAIKESKISVIILSQDFASSKWCLDELAFILECKERNGQHVIPIFYEIDPSHVRYQIGNFATAFAKHEKRLEKRMDRVLIWKDALIKVADLSGFDSNSRDVRDDSYLVEQVIEDILTKLNHESSCDLRDLVGVERRIQQLLLALDITPEDVRVRSVVIWGMGGIGKTTLADVVFHGISSQFEASCFLADVRERSKTKGVVSPNLYKLRDNMVRKLLRDETLIMQTPTVPSFVRVRLQRTKVLLVLDDVDDLIQLEFLVGDKVPFGPGSRILITTRDLKRATEMQMVRKEANHDVKIYNIEKLNVDESRQLFYLDALRDVYSSAILEVIFSEVVDSAAGIPLALKIWHSLFIHCKSIREMENLWNTMKRFPIKKLQNGYRVSYEVLQENEREIFLDIACFHKGKDVSEVKRVLDACGLFSDNGIKCLIDISLISIKDECIWMHDVIQEMGWAIVNEECPEEPGNRTRLYTYKDVRHVLENNTGTAKLQAIFSPWDESGSFRRVKLSPQAFNNMHRLRSLQLDGCEVFSDSHLYVESLPNALGYISWAHCHFKSLPLSFSPNKLVQFCMPHSKLQTLWSEEQNAWSLKKINLSYSSKLVDISGLSKCLNIESINLRGCSSLLQVPSEFQNLTSLTDLNLEFCTKIKSVPEMPIKMEILDLGCTAIERLPSSIFEFMNIKRLSLYGCSRLKKFPEIMEPMECLEFLDLQGTGIEELPCSFGNLVGLKELKLGECSNLQVVYNLKHLEDLSLTSTRWTLIKLPPLSVILWPFMISLNLWGCSSLKEIPDALVNLTSLQVLNLRETKIQIMPPLKQNSGLKTLVLKDCKCLQSLTELPCLLRWLNVEGCTSLKIVSFSMTALTQGLDPSQTYDHIFGGCLNLDENARNNIMDNAQRAIMRLTTANIRELWDECVINVLCPGNKIPKWFSCETEGSSINIKLPLHWADDFLGFAFCIVSERSTSLGDCDQFKLNFKSNDGESHYVDFSIPYKNCFNSDHVLVWYKTKKLSDASKLSTEAFIDFGSDAVVQRCGICFLYDQGQENALKFEVTDPQEIDDPEEEEYFSAEDDLMRASAIR